jgi:hypothetical protein
MLPSKVGPNRKGRPKGIAKSGGRKPGTPNKVTALLKDSILLAAADAGGKDGLRGYLRQQAIANPVAYLQLLGKVLPTQVSGPGGEPLPMPVITFRTIYTDAAGSELISAGLPKLIEHEG